MKYVLALCLTLLSTGCQNSNTVYVPQTSYVVMDDDWLKDCVIVTPPDKDAYRGALEGVKNALWSKTYMKQLMEVDICNKNKAKAREFNAKARAKNALNRTA